MKLICDGLDLSDAVMKVIKAISQKSTNPVLEGIKMVAEDDCLTLTATDLELAIERTIKAEVFLEGEVVVPGKFFAEYIKKLTNEQIEISTSDKNMIAIKYTDSTGNIQAQSAEEFPVIKHLDNPEYFEITSKDLKSLISKSVFCVSNEDSRPILKGVLFEISNRKIKAVALDGYRLAMVNKDLVSNSSDFNCIIPARSLNEISKLLEDTEETIKVCVQKNYLMADVNNTKIITRLLEGDFINYKQIIPTDFTTEIVINKAQLEDGLDRASLLSRIDRNNLVKFDITEKLMMLSSKSDIGDIKENITVSLNGKDLTIAFNVRYFNEALRVINDEFIKLSFTTASAPCILKSNDTDEYVYLILPVRVIN
ncbi:MAG: DNA polymerase III subunit beta [Clostridia bacterium]|nr:DNA polymerase III subunit beta [Clostridia bacterium]